MVAGTEPTIRIAVTDDDLRRCFPTMVQLRQALTEDEFVQRAHRQMEQGYRVAFLEHAGQPVAVAGFRISETLFSGKHLYVDDLVTDGTARSRGQGGRLLGWLLEHACQAGCRMLELDSGVQRFAAHRFYFRHGMHISSYRFRMELGGGSGR